MAAAGPYIAGAAETFAKVRPKYKSFSTWRPSDAESFLQTYRTDRGSFGLLDETTKWAALSICKNIAAEVGDETPLNTLKAALIAAAEELASADGISPSEQQFLRSLRSELGLAQASALRDVISFFWTLQRRKLMASLALLLLLRLRVSGSNADVFEFDTNGRET